MATISREMSNVVIPLKRLTSPISLLLEVRNVKTTDRKSWPQNLFQVLNLFQVQMGHHIKMSLYLPYYWSKDFRM